MLYIAIALNLALILLEGSMFFAIKDKSLILKYYTFLQNALALLTSVVFVIFAVISLISGTQLPALVKGLRFTATCGLAATMLVFALVLAPRFKSGKASHSAEIFGGIDPKRANAILHYICPTLSIVSFVIFEGQPALSSRWTAYAAWPSILYWAVYIFLSVTHLWKEPYGLMGKKQAAESTGNVWKRRLKALALFTLIPAIFIALEYALWWANGTLQGVFDALAL